MNILLPVWQRNTWGWVIGISRPSVAVLKPGRRPGIKSSGSRKNIRPTGRAVGKKTLAVT
jgi:hypothetical protein